MKIENSKCTVFVSVLKKTDSVGGKASVSWIVKQEVTFNKGYQPNTKTGLLLKLDKVSSFGLQEQAKAAAKKAQDTFKKEMKNDGLPLSAAYVLREGRSLRAL